MSDGIADYITGQRADLPDLEWQVGAGGGRQYLLESGRRSGAALAVIRIDTEEAEPFVLEGILNVDFPPALAGLGRFVICAADREYVPLCWHRHSRAQELQQYTLHEVRMRLSRARRRYVSVLNIDRHYASAWDQAQRDRRRPAPDLAAATTRLCEAAMRAHGRTTGQPECRLAAAELPVVITALCAQTWYLQQLQAKPWHRGPNPVRAYLQDFAASLSAAAEATDWHDDRVSSRLSDLANIMDYGNAYRSAMRRKRLRLEDRGQRVDNFHYLTNPHNPRLLRQELSPPPPPLPLDPPPAPDDECSDTAAALADVFGAVARLFTVRPDAKLPDDGAQRLLGELLAALLSRIVEAQDADEIEIFADGLANAGEAFIHTDTKMTGKLERLAARVRQAPDQDGSA